MERQRSDLAVYPHKQVQARYVIEFKISIHEQLAALKQQLPPPHMPRPCEARGRGAGVLSVSASVSSCQQSRRIRGGMGSEAPVYRLQSRNWAVRVRCSGVPVSPEADPEGGRQGVLY